MNICFPPLDSHFCTPCNREFQYEELLKRHNINLHDSRNVICDICGSSWPDELKLRDHQISHSQKRSFECDFPDCGRKFKRVDTWKRHKLTHKARQVECYHCKKKYRNLSTIQRHMARHMQVTPAEHKCDLCPKKFRLLVDKVSHQRTHLRKIFKRENWVVNICQMRYYLVLLSCTFFAYFWIYFTWTRFWFFFFQKSWAHHSVSSNCESFLLFLKIPLTNSKRKENTKKKKSNLSVV
jgi:hypothetical protein